MILTMVVKTHCSRSLESRRSVVELNIAPPYDAYVLSFSLWGTSVYGISHACKALVYPKSRVLV